MSPGWQISAGELFELTRPAAFALSALASTCVFASARRQGFALHAVAAWTLGTLYSPLVVLPIYLIVRVARRRQQRELSSIEQPKQDDSPTIEPSFDPATEQVQTEQIQEEKAARQPRPPLRLLLPLLYLLAVLLLGALLYYRDAQGIDAHLARANRARLLGQRDKTINEYRAALKLEENAHTHNLLGIELAAAGQLEEALAEFRIAEQAGEPDDELPYRIAATLDALKRPPEAVVEYRKFLSTRRCTDSYPDPQCAAARIRIQATVQ